MSAEKRWAFMSRKVIGRQDNPMLIRWRLIQTPWFGLYLHFIHREDLDRMPHDHPWTFWTLLLRGGYVQEYWADSRLRGAIGAEIEAVLGTRGPNQAWRRPGTLRHFPLGACHRIIKVKPGTTSLVLVGRKKRTWGFYDSNGAFIDWREYHGMANGWNYDQERARQEHIRRAGQPR